MHQCSDKQPRLKTNKTMSWILIKIYDGGHVPYFLTTVQFAELGPKKKNTNGWEISRGGMPIVQYHMMRQKSVCDGGYDSIWIRELKMLM